MKQSTELHAGIRGGTKAMHQILVAATEQAEIACTDMDKNEQNAALGTIIVMEDMLDQAINLLKGVIAMHRYRLHKQLKQSRSEKPE